MIQLGLTCADGTSNADKGVSDYECWRKGRIPDHRNMAIFQLTDKFTFSRTVTSDTSRLAVRFLSIFHAGVSRRLADEGGTKIRRCLILETSIRLYI